MPHTVTQVEPDNAAELNGTLILRADSDRPLSPYSQVFTLVSIEGEEINMPLYDLMSWS